VSRPAVPPEPTPALHEWTVAGALVEGPDGILLVRNVRRGGHEDWSTPGGVIDAGESIVDGLTREVEEETGLRVRRWLGPVYEVVAHAPDMRWRMRCEVHVALEYEGDVVVDDPDGIVVEAAFVPVDECHSRVSDCPTWVSEPLAAWLDQRWDPDAKRSFHYDVFGTDRASLRIERVR
jgi:8-oxo-dGTP diphosphatase